MSQESIVHLRNVVQMEPYPDEDLPQVMDRSLTRKMKRMHDMSINDEELILKYMRN